MPARRLSTWSTVRPEEQGEADGLAVPGCGLQVVRLMALRDEAAEAGACAEAVAEDVVVGGEGGLRLFFVFGVSSRMEGKNFRDVGGGGGSDCHAGLTHDTLADGARTSLRSHSSR